MLLKGFWDAKFELKCICRECAVAFYRILFSTHWDKVVCFLFALSRHRCGGKLNPRSWNPPGLGLCTVSFCPRKNPRVSFHGTRRCPLCKVASPSPLPAPFIERCPSRLIFCFPTFYVSIRCKCQTASRRQKCVPAYRGLCGRPSEPAEGSWTQTVWGPSARHGVTVSRSA